ncbi:MAG: response regulator [Polyangiales bacterium]
MSAPRILVVDDNVSLGENIVEILCDAGYEADYFDHPRAALEALRAGVYRAALLDIRMPDMDGVDLYRAIKEVDPAIPAIAMTAWSGDERVRAAVREGVVAVFPKPVDAAILLSRLESVVGGEVALIVEDDDALAQDLCELLTDGGWSVRCAPTCAAAKTLAAQTPPVLLVVDWRLPDGDGIELVGELIRAHEPGTAIVYSGYRIDVQGPAARTAACGATFLEKPADLRRLLQMSAELRAQRLAAAR